MKYQNIQIYSKRNGVSRETAVEAVQYINQRLSVGVITFYRNQKENITRRLTGRLKDCDKVDTVDGFQGSERDVIIISCVRTSQGIGFLHSRERLNVALTRARLCLIVIGDLDFLRSVEGCCNNFDTLLNSTWSISWSSLKEPLLLLVTVSFSSPRKLSSPSCLTM